MRLITFSTRAPSAGWVKEWASRADDPQVSSDLSELTSATRCPSCGATLRPDAPWCTLCYADLRSQPKPVEALPLAAPNVPWVASEDQVAQAQPLLQAEPTWPCTSCAAVNPFSASVCVACGSRFLAGVRETEKPLLVLPVVGDVQALSRGQRLALAMGIVLTIVALLALIAFLTTHTPPVNAGSKAAPTAPLSGSAVP